MQRRIFISLYALLLIVFAVSGGSLSTQAVGESQPFMVMFTGEIIFLMILVAILIAVVSGLGTALVIWIVRIRTMSKGALRFDMVMETASVDHQLGGDLQVIIFSTKDQSIASAFSSVHKRMSSCFREIGFQVFFSETLQIELEKYPTMIAVDFKKHKKPVKMVERLYRKYKEMGNIPVIFYNVPNPSEFEAGNKLQETYLLGEMFKEQDLMKIASAVVEMAEKRQPNVLQGAITGEGIVEILQLLELGKRSGMLKIRDSKKQLLGEIGFHLGTVVFARSARGIGDIAALDIVGFRTGHFSFSARDVEGHNCQLIATSLIMQAAQLHDEQQHGLAQVL